MPSVKDVGGKEWSFTVNVASLARVKEGMKWDLLSVVGDKNSLPRLFGDPELLTGCLYFLCGSSVGQLTREQWGESWSGDSLDRAYEAICEGLIDFFPSSRRQSVADLIRTYNEITATAREMAPQELAEAKRIALEEMSGKKSGSSQESLESIPENSLSENSIG